MHPEGSNDVDAAENAKDQLRKELFEIITSNPHGHLDDVVRSLFAAKLQAYVALCGDQFDRSDILFSIGTSIFGVDLSEMTESSAFPGGPKTHVEHLTDDAPPTGNEKQREGPARPTAKIISVPPGFAQYRYSMMSSLGQIACDGMALSRTTDSTDKLQMLAAASELVSQESESDPPRTVTQGLTGRTIAGMSIISTIPRRPSDLTMCRLSERCSEELVESGCAPPTSDRKPTVDEMLHLLNLFGPPAGKKTRTRTIYHLTPSAVRSRFSRWFPDFYERFRYDEARKRWVPKHHNGCVVRELKYRRTKPSPTPTEVRDDKVSMSPLHSVNKRRRKYG